MKLKVAIAAACFLAVCSSGCTGRSVFTVEVYQTPTSLSAAIEPSATPVQGPVAPSVPTSTPILEPFSALPTSVGEPVMPAGFSPILYGRKYDANTFFTLLGAVQGTTWLTAEQAAAQFSGEWEYDVHTLAGGSFQLRGHAPEFSPQSNLYFVRTDANLDEPGMVAVVHGWAVQQGTVDELSPAIDIYQDVVMDWLTSQGVQSPVLGDMRVLRVDLEADGVDEIFISVTHLDGSQHTVWAGDYSVILMRKVVGNDVTTVPVVADIYYSSGTDNTFPSAYAPANFIDLDQDGVLEVIVDVQRWEADAALLFKVDGQNVRQVP